MEIAADQRPDAPDGNDPLRPSPGVALERAGREAILYDRRSRQAHVVNESAARLFELCDGEATLEEITDQFAAAYGLTAADVADDVQTIVDTFRRLRVLA